MSETLKNTIFVIWMFGAVGAGSAINEWPSKPCSDLPHPTTCSILRPTIGMLLAATWPAGAAAYAGNRIFSLDKPKTN